MVRSAKEKFGNKDRLQARPGPPKEVVEDEATATQKSYPADLMRRAEISPGSLRPTEVLQLQRAVGNRMIGRLLPKRSPPPSTGAESKSRPKNEGRANHRSGQNRPVQLKLENTSYNDLVTLGGFKAAVETYALTLSTAVETARDMIATKYFVHVPAVDGYMQNFLDNFQVGTNSFNDGAAMPRQAGYWIESYATKIAAPAAGGGLDVILQAKRGASRPDVVLQYQGRDMAWLDITSGASEGHIFDKNSAGWLGTPYVTEVTYDALKLNVLNTVSIPDKNTRDIGALLARANEAYQKQLMWEAQVLEKHGRGFGSLMHAVYYYVKQNAVQHEEQNDMQDEEMDKAFSPDVKGNKFEKLAVSFIAEKAGGSPPDPRELAGVIMYWQGMVQRYEKRFAGKLPAEYHLPNKEQLGLSWVNDISSADGEPFIRQWFPV